MLKTPVRALDYFEHQTQTHVVFYNNDSIFSMIFGIRLHDYRICWKAKEKHRNDCILFDLKEMERNAWRMTDGCVKICAAGVLEWVIPVMNGDKRLCLLSAGIRRAPEKLPENLAVYRQTECSAYTIPDQNLPETNADEILTVMEALCQFAARLEQWYIRFQKKDFDLADLSRKDMIRSYLAGNYRSNPSLPELARLMNRSIGRTSNIVREEMGSSFVQLLLQVRLENAVRLLRDTNLSIKQIIPECGFGDEAYFHKAFRKKYGYTPGSIRKKALSDFPAF